MVPGLFIIKARKSLTTAVAATPQVTRKKVSRTAKRAL